MFLKQDSSFTLQARLTETVASSQVEISVTYKDNTNNDYSDVIVTTNDKTPVTLLTAPPVNTVNIVELIKIHNPDTQSATVEILAGTTVVYTCTIGTNQSVILSEVSNSGLGFSPLAINGDGSKLTGITTAQITDTEDKRFVTGDEKANYNTAYSEAHTHSNKTLLDSITSGGNGNSYLANDGTYKLISSDIQTGTCSTTSETAEKTVTLNGFSLSTGVTIFVTFDNANTATAPTLNVNSTRTIAIYSEAGTAVSSTNPAYFPAGSTVEFTYNGTYWIYKNRVVNNYINGTSWYRQYSSGWIEQGGVTSATGSDSNSTIPLIKSFINANYSIITTAYVPSSQYENSSGAANYAAIDNWAGVIKSKTTSSFVLVNGYNSKIWEAKGY